MKVLRKLAKNGESCEKPKDRLDPSYVEDEDLQGTKGKTVSFNLESHGESGAKLFHTFQPIDLLPPISMY